jgi:hypothetical protein
VQEPTVTAAISAYAAFVGTAALAWQIMIWRRTRRTAVDVSLSLGRHYEPIERLSVHVRVVNHSDHQITVDQVSIEGQSHPNIPSIVVLGGWQGRVVPALDGLTDGALLTEEGLDWTHPVQARVLLATGASFLSTPTSLPHQ